jgi:hypothetical protein
LYGIVRDFPVSFSPSLNVLGDNGLAAAVIYVDMPHDLFAPAPHARQGLHLRLRGSQQLRSQIPERLDCWSLERGGKIVSAHPEKQR